MAIYPVIMCGGAGTRLWPASRPTRPKQFLNLTGRDSLFQDTARRVSPLARDGGSLVIVCGLSHRQSVAAQLAEIGLSAVILLEPEARDSAPAMAAAAAWIAGRDADGVAVYVASDHHLPDAEAFCDAAFQAAAAALDRPCILTLGVKPTEPSSAYGYIKATGPGLAPVEAFVEKPTPEAAVGFIAAGYLWNSGNFVVRAQTLLDELARHEPGVGEAAIRSLAEATEGPVIALGDAFRSAPKVSIDYAVMEKTTSAWVLPVDFAWSDLGAWDSVAATGAGGQGLAIHEGEGACYVRVADGMVVATVGVRDLAVIAEQDAVLVCDLAASQKVKSVVDRLRSVAPEFLSHRPVDPPVQPDVDSLRSWLMLRALPFWTSFGVDDLGRFAEVLDAEGRDVADFKRARVPARQIYVLAGAGRLGWPGRWRSALEQGLDCYWADFALAEGDVRARVSRDGRPRDDEPYLYDQAFALLALASAKGAGVQPQVCAERAERLRRRLDDRRVAAGGWRESGDRPFQGNAHMHLLEASLAWEVLEPDGPWRAMADEIVALALGRFIDPATGALSEFFTPDWSGPPVGEVPVVEPGHQFEWAWLFARYARARGNDGFVETARRLYACGVKGVHPTLGVACDQLSPDLTTCSNSARLWPQTEWLKAATILSEAVPTEMAYQADGARARSALARYLIPDGRWRDLLRADGSFDDQPAPASSFYHIMAAMEQLSAGSPG
ncbi:MAG: AGE family epimerase/isomerase [Alphaproteobacteria bacterium]|nr:AGE family epimerase/isomerase [Alphaproteobacteria bacterium]MBU1525477.1 AGE family epimerase/isomerase [Alphaproteobacteria bacterium]MBU2116311.1 AGE family epimerase/isomerase [Alphaproteobacteria bacterium]MBU2350879.1 AGE family epimerase/isomerase [Alphaproteobacteria bacterium]MBU2381740.1 AGE family epimerase/isomerase [Alphaproteobacteria bacterium]